VRAGFFDRRWSAGLSASSAPCRPAVRAARGRHFSVARPMPMPVHASATLLFAVGEMSASLSHDKNYLSLACRHEKICKKILACFGGEPAFLREEGTHIVVVLPQAGQWNLQEKMPHVSFNAPHPSFLDAGIPLCFVGRVPVSSS